MKQNNFYGREAELKRLHEIWSTQGAELIFVRGRRRIGKSELLRELTKEHSGAGGRAFRFSGRVDETDALCRERFAKAWMEFTKNLFLKKLRRDALTWDFLLRELENEATKPHISQLPLLVAFDEIQWLAKKHSGILGCIKEFWERIHKKINIKLLLSGSSNRFFAAEVDHSEGVLRGLRTKGDLWVHPFTLDEVSRYYFPKWNAEQIVFLYMMFGGVPYYLDRFDASKPFLRAINDAAFTDDSIFLDEVDAILEVESTGEGAILNVKRVLGSLGQSGKTAAGIEKVTGIASPHVHQILNRLESYGLIKELIPFGEKKRNKAGVRYHMDDFFLNTYFQILEPMSAKIRDNSRKGMPLNDLLSSDNGYYILNFTGKAFELLVTNILNAGATNTSHRKALLFSKLQLGSSSFQVGTFWTPNQTQIDIVISCNDDRQVRILEAKWKGSAVGLSEGEEFLEALESKAYPLPRDNWSKKLFLVLSGGATDACKKMARDRDISIITLDDLFA